MNTTSEWETHTRARAHVAYKERGTLVRVRAGVSEINITFAC